MARPKKVIDTPVEETEVVESTVEAPVEEPSLLDLPDCPKVGDMDEMVKIVSVEEKVINGNRVVEILKANGARKTL